jgi:hypothetical protein
LLDANFGHVGSQYFTRGRISADGEKEQSLLYGITCHPMIQATKISSELSRLQNDIALVYDTLQIAHTSLFVPPTTSSYYNKAIRQTYDILIGLSPLFEGKK